VKNRAGAQILALAITFSPLPAQKIDSETPGRDRVVRVQTAMNHLTVIEVAEPVTTVAVGSPQAFKIERRENKVFIEPLEENVATNLFIWTASTRLNYELIPAVSDAGQMDFAIDYRPPQPKAQLAEPKSAQPADPVSTLPGEMLLNGTPVRFAGIESKANPCLLIRDVYRKGNEVFIRYSIENRSAGTLRTGVPTVSSLTDPRTDKSLWTLQNVQLGANYMSKLRTGGPPVQMKVTRAPAAAQVAPGATHVGLIGVEFPGGAEVEKQRQPTVLEIRVPMDHGDNAIAALVL
jgi:hypothetical protein